LTLALRVVEKDTAKDAKTLQTIRVEATAAATSTAAKLPLTLHETPQSVTVVTRERLDDQNLVSLQDVLDNTPGVYTYGGPDGGVTFREGDVTQISLMARYQFTPRISVQLNGRNLLDERTGCSTSTTTRTTASRWRSPRH
jgi:outer membrane receptor for ferric coprogen and ferric-rhodotorulic acid